MVKFNANALKHALREKEMSVRDLAAIYGCSYQNMYRIINDQYCSLKILKRICDAIPISMDDIVDTQENIIGKHIRQIRLYAGLSLKDFAKQIGVQPYTAYRYEHGISEITSARLTQIADNLNVPVSVLLGEEKKAEFSAKRELITKSDVKLCIQALIGDYTDEKFELILKLVKVYDDKEGENYDI